jgi:ABC-type polysaccharide/polyol phosphate transport system ATPase subunit
LKYTEFKALTDVSLSVTKGGVLGIIGDNGAGKSTLLKIISGVLKPTTGSVTVSGTIAPMLELGAGFDNELSARENVFLNGAILGYPEAFIKEKYIEIMDFSELWDFANVPVRNFSSGMVARLAFSIATLVTPEILIVDEVLSVGDEGFRRKSEAKMLEMMRGGATVLFVSHSIEQIRALCSEVLWLEHGRVKMLGTPDVVCGEYIKRFE